MFLRFTIAILISPLFLTWGFAQSSEAKTIDFKNNRFVIENKYLTDLDDVGEMCSLDTFSFLKIVAYADTIGTKKYNVMLSKKRAMEVYSYLTKKFSIDASKIYVTWLGEETEGSYDLHFPNPNVQQRCVDILVSFTNSRSN